MRLGRVLGWIAGAVVALALGAAAFAWLTLRASLPRIEGEATLAGLRGAVTIERDAAGVPVIRGGTRADVARATGYAHAQDRLFQMDLLRRVGAGELSALLGPGLLDRDRRIRLHQFRARAALALAALDAGDRALLEAYSEGVNAVVAEAGARPFEYLLLRVRPAPWRPEDCLLVAYAQWIDLQGLDDSEERRNGRLAAVLPASVTRLLTQPDPTFEAPLDGSRLEAPSLPDPAEYDLRALGKPLFDRVDGAREARLRIAGLPEESAPGSNNFAVAAARTADGRALVANDMHLRLRVPNIWYRARLVVAGEGLDIAGVTLPGLPAVVAGSNGHVAWGFTNSYGDFQDLVRIEPGPAEGSYLAPGGPRPFQIDEETIEVAGGAPERLAVKKTVWGPVVGQDGEGRALALAWTAHRPEATDLAVMRLERAQDLEEAAAIAGGAAMPGQNVMIADSTGRIGWVLSGRLPVRAGIDATRPSDWRAAGAGWKGWVPRAESPRRLDPPEGYAWSANARVVGGADYARIGDGDFAPAARARQIRDRLAALERATPADLLAIQLDDRADYLAHWQPVAAKAFEQSGHREAARLVAGWSGHAAVGDAGYRLVREFERRLTDRAFTMLAAPAEARWPAFDWDAPQRFTETAWRLVEARPAHLLDPRFPDWDAWLADVASRTARDLPKSCASLADCTWGRVNTTRIQHPISAALPALARFLDMPSRPLPGDSFVPRVQGPDFGASERFVVSPGRESEGLFQMPGGQSGHPLSPFYRAGFDDWAAGRPAPFLPGPAVHVLTLAPPGA